MVDPHSICQASKLGFPNVQVKKHRWQKEDPEDDHQEAVSEYR